MGKWLKTSLAEANPTLAAQWHPTKNGVLKPEDVSPNSHMKVWWFLPYDDPRTGKHFDFEWPAKIDDRNRGCGCPFLSGRAIWVSFNDLATTHEELLKQWHPTKNGNLKPTDVSAGSSKKVWWFLPYDDPRTSKHFDFEWEAQIDSRALNNNGCPFLANRLLYPDYNSLATVRPDLAKEWDFGKNGDITPRDIIIGSAKKVWWKCEKGHSWKASVSDRCNSNTGCPHCVKSLKTSFPEQALFYYIKQVFPDAINEDLEEIGLELDVYIPSINTAIEYDGKLWHMDADRDLKKNAACKKHGIRLIRIREIGCAEINEDDCEILEVVSGNKISLAAAINTVANMLNINIDVDIPRDTAEILNMIIHTTKEESLAKLYPEVALQWHPTKNGKLTPDCVHSRSAFVAWWYLPYDDPETGEHFDFEWPTAIRERTERGSQCPYLTGSKVWPTFNSLLVLNENLALEWNYEKNKGLTNKRGEDISKPDKVSPNSRQKVWWKCSKCEYEWETYVSNRGRLGSGCPECYRNRRNKNIAPLSDEIDLFN